MKKVPYFPRLIRTRLLEALDDTPAVLIHGPRQSGKTTLTQRVGEERDYAYVTFDDANILAAATEDPVGFVDRLPKRVILDEVQRVPELFTALKREIDRDRLAGRFLLTGSANVLLAPRLSDSLAGRMEILRLYPLAQCEIEQVQPGFLRELFAGTFQVSTSQRLGDELVQRVLTGGYPEPHRRAAGRRRREWYRNYIETITQRDIRDLSRLRRLDAIPKLLQMVAGQSAQLFNVSELAGPFQLTRPTIREYVGLLEKIFLVDVLPPWHSNRLKRLVKTPKLHLGDTGLAGAVLGIDVPQLINNRALFGQMLETFVYNELKRQASWQENELTFFHYRDKDQYEVDLVIEQVGGQVAGVEVKASATVREKDFRGLRRLRQATGRAFSSGVVLYDGDSVLPFGDHLFAVPISALWVN
jgi:predicted AAA+ superfamily ATPase